MYTHEEYQQIEQDIFRRMDDIDRESSRNVLVTRIAEAAYRKHGKAEEIENIAAGIRESLSSVNWEEILLEIRIKEEKFERLRAEIHYAHAHTFRECDSCHKQVTNKELKSFETVYHGHYCQACVEVLSKKLYRVCAFCGTTYTTKLTNENLEVCYSCRTPEVIKEWKRIQSHLTRASSAGQDRTLDIKQWMHTLETFGQRCAYCQGTYKHLEHYIPLPYAGTTQSNCFPACGRCNHIKSDKLPEVFECLFPAENIQRIKEYQASLAIGQLPGVIG